MEDRIVYKLIESVDNLTSAVTELCVKLKRASQSPLTHEKYNEILKAIKDGKD